MRRIVIIIVLLFACTMAHALVPHEKAELHEFLFKVTYVPIILAALWFGVRGGLAASIVMSGLYLLHLHYQLHGQPLSMRLGWTLDLVLYNVIALVTGLLAQAQSRARTRAEALASEQSSLRSQLEDSYGALRQQTENILEMTEELHRTERLAALGELTAGIAHEIRNPLSGISGAAEIVSRENVTPEVRAEFSGILRKEAARLNQVVQNILDFARDNRAEMRDVPLHEVAGHVLALTAKETSEHGVRVTQHVPADVHLHTEANLLEHILLNLVLNAIQAMPGGGELVISAESDGKTARLIVSDTGPGISADAQESVFEPFFTTKSDGTGLGLPIARRIARGLGGDILLRPKPGPGAEFVIELPVRLAAPASPLSVEETEEYA